MIISLDPSLSLSRIRGIGPKFLTKFKKLGIETVRDLIFHFPIRYEDFSEVVNIADLIPNQEATVTGVVTDIDSRRSWQRNMTIVEAIVEDKTGSIRAVWFNQPYIKRALGYGESINLSGKVVLRRGELHFSNPSYESVSAKSRSTKHTARIVPVYPETKGLTSRGIRYILEPILKNVRLNEFIPANILKEAGLPKIDEALQEMHFPTNIDNAIRARKRFAFEDLFLLQLYNLKQKENWLKQETIKIKTDIDYLKNQLKCLPFELTGSQKETLWEILKDISKHHPMNRLLQGDVGSGKTIVAALGAFQAAKNGLQAAFMAPTEILARQHYKTITKFFPEFEGGIALLTSSDARIFYGKDLESQVKKEQVKKEISQNKVKIAIGTHALIQKEVMFGKLAFVVVDEQHRFGVKQRAKLLHVGENTPHFLSMSATPIPRTLSLTLFGDLDISLIKELPKDRKPIITRVVPPAKRKAAYDFIRKQVKMGRQAFVICPRIAASEITNRLLLEVKNVTEEYEKLSKKVFPDLRVAMLHGKMKSKEKEGVMQKFANGDINILVSTSVVEVGVDIPNATIMMIEGAERFGLAQLYQFRGRVGRGEHQSYCLLFTDSSSESTKSRLRSIERAKNGFELAEMDLKLRGPGEFLGVAQTGMPDLAMKAIQNPELVKAGRKSAAAVLQEDPLLKKYPALKTRFQEFQKAIHKE